MRTQYILSVAAFSLLVATGAYAGEGEGGPPAYRAPGITITNAKAYAATGSQATYPDLTGRPAQVVAANNVNGLLPITGRQSTAQTANSLPRGFQAGTPAVAYAQSVNRHLTAQTARIVQTAQHTSSGDPKS